MIQPRVPQRDRPAYKKVEDIFIELLPILQTEVNEMGYWKISEIGKDYENGMSINELKIKYESGRKELLNAIALWFLEKEILKKEMSPYWNEIKSIRIKIVK